MNEREINHIRRQFTLVSTISFFGVMLFMGGCIYLFSTLTVRNESRKVMQYIAENDGDIPLTDNTEDVSEGPDSEDTDSEDPDYEDMDSEKDFSESDIKKTMEWSLRRIFGIQSPKDEAESSLDSTRYFAVLFDKDGEIEDVKTPYISSIDTGEAELYARYALSMRSAFGNIGRFYYLAKERSATAGTIVIYLDRTAQIMAIRRILFIALTLLGFGTLLAFFFMRIFSVQIVRTEMENAEKQKQFITNASHELKTPLAVIRANTEMQEMLDGETEWTRSTMRQVDRMSGLISNLVMVARSREQETGKLSSINIAPAVRETASSFAAVAASDGKTLEMQIPKSVMMKADDSRIRQLVSLLADNAVKYCDPAGTVLVDLSRTGRTTLLSVSNDYAAGENIDCSRFFERFYREDEARTITGGDPSGKSGYGVGLSIAENLAASLGGTIGAAWKDGQITFACRFRD